MNLNCFVLLSVFQNSLWYLSGQDLFPYITVWRSLMSACCVAGWSPLTQFRLPHARVPPRLTHGERTGWTPVESRQLSSARLLSVSTIAKIHIPERSAPHQEVSCILESVIRLGAQCITRPSLPPGPRCLLTPACLLILQLWRRHTRLWLFSSPSLQRASMCSSPTRHLLRCTGQACDPGRRGWLE